MLLVTLEEEVLTMRTEKYPHNFQEKNNGMFVVYVYKQKRGKETVMVTTVAREEEKLSRSQQEGLV